MDDLSIIVLPDRNGKWFWAFYTNEMTVVSHTRHETSDRADQAGREMREKISAVSAFAAHSEEGK